MLFRSVEDVNHGNQVGGEFKVTFCHNDVCDETADFIQADATASDVETALEGLSTIDAVTVSDDSAYLGMARGQHWDVTFTHENQGGKLAKMSIVTEALTGAGATVAVDKLVNGNELTGSFRITYGNEETTDLSHDISAEALKQQLELLEAIDTVKVTRATYNEIGRAHV